MKRIAIYGKRHQERHLPMLEEFFRKLRERGFVVSLAERFGEYLQKEGLTLPEGFKVSKEMPADTECIFSIGGDGTFLRAAQWGLGREQKLAHATALETGGAETPIFGAEIPILGINTGHLGFLASYSLEEMDELLDVVEKDLGVVEKRMVLEVRSASLPADFVPYALNEVAMMRGETASMLTVHAEVDGYFLADYPADGLVVATPTGSTAYNLSAGGPIMMPTLDCAVLSPIAPHSLTMRPLVVSGDSEIRLTAHSRVAFARVSLDGRSFMIGCGEELRIRRAGFSVMALRRPDGNFAGLLRQKLLWAQR